MFEQGIDIGARIELRKLYADKGDQMTDKRFPLTSRLNLQFHKFQLNKMTDKWSDEMISADDLERILEDGVTVYSCELDKNLEWGIERAVNDTHTAIIIGIEQIERESAEDLLREIVEVFKIDRHMIHNALADPIKKAKAFLEREKEREGL